MDFSSLSPSKKKELSDLMFQLLSSPEELKDWIKFFLNLEYPTEMTDIETTSNPLDAIWQIYNTFRNNSGNKYPGYILLSARECLKTISTAVVEILLLIHFQIDIGHASATEDQSSIALGYINEFVIRISPLLKTRGWDQISENKRLIKFKTPEGKRPFIKIVITTLRGMNSLHANVLFLDELDLADPKALKEGRFIVGYSKGWHGIKVYLSTRKYAFGPMAQAIEDAPKMNYRILRWNVLDVTEYCPTSRHKPEGDKKDMYVAKNLPLTKITPEDFRSIPESEQVKYDLIENVYEGCRNCDLLPVCRMRLSQKATNATGGFYKPISTIIQAFKENDADSAEAQLLCWRPGNEGLVYSRFNSTPGKGNVISLKEAYETFAGPTKKTFISEADLINELKKAEIPMHVGLDWGYVHDFVIIVAAILPTGEVWIIDCYAAPGLEFPDMLNVAASFRDKYDIHKWWVDQAHPEHVKSFNRNRMKAPKFTKQVMGGIESIRSKIINGSGKRLFKIVQTPTTGKVITAMTKHRFLTDGQGNLTLEPDNERGVADICDALRYIGQNVFPVKGPQKPEVTWTEVKDGQMPEQNPTITQQMKEEISKRILDTGEVNITTGKKGGFHFNF